MTGISIGGSPITGVYVGNTTATGVYKGATKLWSPATSSGITRIASAYVVNTSGGFDRSASIPDIGPIPAGALIVVKSGQLTKMDVTDSAGNTYALGTDGTTGWRAATMARHCLAAAASATNAFSFDIEDNGGGASFYVIAVEVYTGPGSWAYLAAQSGITELSYATADTVQSAAITTSAAGVISGLAYSQNPSSGPVSRAWSPGDLLVATSCSPAGAADSDAASGAYMFDAPITAQKITAGAGRTGEYKYIDLNCSTFTNS